MDRRSRNRREGDLFALARKALASGATLTRSGRLIWNAAGRCEDPQYRYIRGIPDDYLVRERRRIKAVGAQRSVALLGKLYDVFSSEAEGFALHPARWRPGCVVRIEMWVRCRRCGTCLRDRAAEWAARALAETIAAPRTWFATFTLNDESLAHFTNVARTKSLGIEELPGSTFVNKVRAISPELTKWFKRVREQSGVTLRFLLVAEVHPGPGPRLGEPHFHALVHEMRGTLSHEQLTWRLVDRQLWLPWTGRPWKKMRASRWPRRRDRNGEQWPFGFTKFKLVKPDDNPAYLTKYLAKDNIARVRASLDYGKTISNDSERSEA